MALKYVPADWLTFNIISRDLVHTAMHIMFFSIFPGLFICISFCFFCTSMSILVRIV